MQNIAIAKEGDEHQEQCLFFFRINQFELLNKSHVSSAGFLGWSMAHPDHPLAPALQKVWRTSCSRWAAVGDAITTRNPPDTFQQKRRFKASLRWLVNTFHETFSKTCRIVTILNTPVVSIVLKTRFLTCYLKSSQNDTELDTFLSVVNQYTHYKAYQTFVYIHVKTCFDIIRKSCQIYTRL